MIVLERLTRGIASLNTECYHRRDFDCICLRISFIWMLFNAYKRVSVLLLAHI